MREGGRKNDIFVLLLIGIILHVLREGEGRRGGRREGKGEGEELKRCY